MSPKRCGGVLRPPACAGAGRMQAGKDNTFVGSSLPRQRRLSARMAESSVSTIASSPSIVDAMAAAAAIVRRSKALMPRCAFHSGESTMTSIATTMGAFGDEDRLGFVRGRALIPSLACGKNTFGCDKAQANLVCEGAHCCRYRRHGRFPAVERASGHQG